MNNYTVGNFRHTVQHMSWTAEEIRKAHVLESCTVYENGRAICQTKKPEKAQWLTERLNLAEKLEAKYGRN